MGRTHGVHFRTVPVEDDQDAANRQTASLAGLAVALFLVVVCLILVRQLHAHSALEDCLMSGRTNCIPIATIRT